MLFGLSAAAGEVMPCRAAQDEAAVGRSPLSVSRSEILRSQRDRSRDARTI